MQHQSTVTSSFQYMGRLYKRRLAQTAFIRYLTFKFPIQRLVKRQMKLFCTKPV